MYIYYFFLFCAFYNFKILNNNIFYLPSFPPTIAVFAFFWWAEGWCIVCKQELTDQLVPKADFVVEREWMT